MAIYGEESSIQALSGKELTRYKVFSAASDTASGDELDARNADAISLLVESSTGVSAGTVLLEGAPSASYTGTWISLGSLTINAASKAFGVSIGLGATTGFPCRVVRARISSAITGGTIVAYIFIQR